NVLIAGKDGLDSEHDPAVASQSALLNQRCGVALGRRQCVIVADENNVSGLQGVLNLLGIEKTIVAAEGFGELAKIFAVAVRILGADFALHPCQRVELCRAAAGSQIYGRRHKSSFQLPASKLPAFLSLDSGSLTPYAPTSAGGRARCSGSNREFHRFGFRPARPGRRTGHQRPHQPCPTDSWRKKGTGAFHKSRSPEKPVGKRKK